MISKNLVIIFLFILNIITIFLLLKEQEFNVKISEQYKKNCQGNNSCSQIKMVFEDYSALNLKSYSEEIILCVFVNENQCNICLENDISFLLEQVNKDNLIVFLQYKNYNWYRYFKNSVLKSIHTYQSKNYNFQLFQFIHEYPVYFTLSSSGIAGNFYFSDPDNFESLKLYLKIIKQKYEI